MVSAILLTTKGLRHMSTLVAHHVFDKSRRLDAAGLRRKGCK